ASKAPASTAVAPVAPVAAAASASVQRGGYGGGSGLPLAPLASAAEAAAEVKIDAEGADRACLSSLKAAGAMPRYLSTELPNLLTEGPEAAIALVQMLESMGYSWFKLCRQSIYNARTVLAVDQLTNKTDIMVSRQGVGLGASGLFGEAA
ncbi:unnamed protein product, partial [Polarella glacialis]